MKSLYYKKGLLLAVIGVLFSACASSSPKIVIPSYTAPKEAAKLSKIETKDEFISKGAYLALWLNPDVNGVSKTNPNLKKYLINSVKSAITQTNFIALDPLGDDEGVALNMEVTGYEFKKSRNFEKLYLEVTFTLERGVDEFLVKKYSKRVTRQSKDPSRLPSENELASYAAKKVVKYFISDISPLKTNQLREFKSLPSELEYVVDFAKRKDYKGAIDMMERYKGKKDMDYYYNLAILYEALASENEDLKLLSKANLNYVKAFQKGGVKDEVIANAKARFDNFYELLHKTKKMQKNNAKLMQDRNSMANSSDSEYE